MPPKPLLVIDARLVKAIPDGMVLYVQGLVQGLRELSRESALAYEPVLLVSTSEKRRLERGEAKWNHGFRFEEVSAPFLHPREWLEIPAALKRLRAAAYHSPTFSSLMYCPCPALITIHDLNHLTYGTWEKKLYYRFVLKPFARSAAQVLAVSQTSAREVETWLGDQDARRGVGVAYNSVRPVEATVDPAFLAGKNLTEGKYFICMANAKPHKNVSLLLRAFLEYTRDRRKRGMTPWSLVLSTGSQGLSAEEKSELAANLVTYETTGMGPTDYQPLFSGAGGVLWPSLYEGFGRPPVEAALAGKKLAVSDIPVHREVLSDLKPGEAHWVDPGSQAAWMSAMEALSSGSILCSASSETRRLLADRFSDLALAKRMDHYYRFVLRGRN